MDVKSPGFIGQIPFFKKMPAYGSTDFLRFSY